jgi:hypothetical protein
MRFLFAGWFSATAEGHYNAEWPCGKRGFAQWCFTDDVIAGRTASKPMRKLLFRSWIALWLIAMVLFLYPINNRPLRLGLILCMLGIWIGCLHFGWRQRAIRFGLLLCTLSAGSINHLDPNEVLPGDIAVTTSGFHVLAGLGGGEWIEADPHFAKVIIVKVPAVKNPWFDEPVNIMRWTVLE